MSSTDERMIIEKKEYIELIQDKGFLMGRIAELEKQINVLKGTLNQK